jgi:hypothetical protein
VTDDDILVTSESLDELEVVAKLTASSFFNLSILTVDFPNYTASARLVISFAGFLHYIQNIPVPVAPMTLMK